MKTSHQIYARVAGFTFLAYIAAGITSMTLGDQSQASGLLALIQSFSALTLGVTLFALTYEQGLILALFALTCRVAEAIQSGESAAIYFSVGSLFFSWLLLRGRSIPTWLAWVGVIASALLVVILPLQLVGFFGGTMSWASSVTWLVWLPMLVFEVTLAFWFMIKGVAIPTAQNRLSNI
ncbi:MAG: hypothetical protein DCC56_05775 [Anaerolineae bacterium]|nr:MAG: hypothetical protein DCC56_05775 [Anaerolineae bacterium]WKZ43637.1 MAG: DUF4386 family protein [Anaerolineales bacterium]